MLSITPPILNEYLASFSVLNKPVDVMVDEDSNCSTDMVFTGIVSSANFVVSSFFSLLPQDESNMFAVTNNNENVLTVFMSLFLFND
jgi:hypothetical protein